MKKKTTKASAMRYVLPLAVLVVGAASFATWKIIDLRGEVASLNTSLNQARQELDSIKNDIVSDPSGVVSRLQQEKNSSILEQVGKLYALPEDETPTIATIEDITKLTDQPFFAGAQNGDILIVFNKSSQAVIYRPSTNQLVKVGPISAQNQENTPAKTETPAKEPTSEE